MQRAHLDTLRVKKTGYGIAPLGQGHLLPLDPGQRLLGQSLLRYLQIWNYSGYYSKCIKCLLLSSGKSVKSTHD